MKIKFGPAGNSKSFYDEGCKESLEAPKWLREKGLDLYEISFGRGIVFSETYALKLKEQLQKYNIEPSIHAPYYINLANPDEEMAEKSINYILASLKILRILGGKKLVVHSGTQLKQDRNIALENTKKRYERLVKAIYENGYDDMYICPETMGKHSQIGNPSEIFDLCKIDKIFIPTLDFGHINAETNGSLKTKEDFEKIIDECFEKLGEIKTKNMHIHFSKIQYSEKGEIKHLTFEDNIYGPDYKLLIEVLKEKGIMATIICESKDVMAEDAKTMQEYYESL